MNIAMYGPMPPPPRTIRSSDGDSSFRASDDTTIAETESGSVPPTPRQPPAYGDEGAPPQYEESIDPNDVKARRAVRKTLCIRLMTSIFITVIVSLIVAAVVAKMHIDPTDSAPSNQHSVSHDASNEVGVTTTISDPIISATVNAMLDGNTTQSADTARPTATTSSDTTNATPVTVDCGNISLTDATLVTDTTSLAADVSTQKVRRNRRIVREALGDVVGVSVYAMEGCLLARTSYKGGESGSVTYKCTMTCPDRREAAIQARHEATDEWGACG